MSVLLSMKEIGKGFTKRKKDGNEFIFVSINIRGERLGINLFPNENKNQKADWNAVIN